MILNRAQNLKSRLKKGCSTVFLTLCIVMPILILHLIGSWEMFECMMYDYWFQMRPLETLDNRIAIVTIDESDISNIKKWPFPDVLLAKAIANIEAAQPRAIGLDIYRDLPVEPGYQDLIKVFTENPHIIGVKKVVQSTAGLGVAPPPILSQQRQVAATDLVIDSDGKLRRNLLSLKDRDEQTVLALGTKLALLYLEREGISPQTTNVQSQQLHLGKGVFKPLRPNNGGYVDLDLGGYQMLANFRRSESGFSTISFSRVLAGEIEPSLISDRIVLIGLKAESLQDRFYTPYSTSIGTTLAGVEIHADLASQIVATALDGRRMFRFWSETTEWLWLIFWSAIGAILAWLLPSPKWIFGGFLVASSILVISTYLLFLNCYWVIFVSPMLALISSVIGNTYYRLWSNLKFSYGQLTNYAQTLENRVAARTEDLQQKIKERRLVQAQLQTSLAEKEVLLKEVYHRVKNNLQVGSSLFSLQSQYTTDTQVLSILTESQNRLQSMALVHQQLYQSEQLSYVDFAGYLEKLVDRLFSCYQISRQRIDLDLRVDRVCLNLDTAIICGLIANELISNSLKHAFPSSRQGLIEVQLSNQDGESLKLIIRDNGIGFPSDFDIQQTNSLGLRLVRILTRQLKGRLEILDAPTIESGIGWQIIFPQSILTSK